MKILECDGVPIREVSDQEFQQLLEDMPWLQPEDFAELDAAKCLVEVEATSLAPRSAIIDLIDKDSLLADAAAWHKPFQSLGHRP